MVGFADKEATDLPGKSWTTTWMLLSFDGLAIFEGFLWENVQNTPSVEPEVIRSSVSEILGHGFMRCSWLEGDRC